MLGSAPPALETYCAAKNKKIDYLVLSRRATETALPNVKIVDMKKKVRLQDSSLLLSTELREALTVGRRVMPDQIGLHQGTGRSTS